MFRSSFDEMANRNRMGEIEPRIFEDTQDSVRINAHDNYKSGIDKNDFVTDESSYISDEDYETSDSLNKVFRPEVLRQFKPHLMELQCLDAQELNNIIYESSHMNTSVVQPLPEFNMSLKQNNDDLYRIKTNYKSEPKKNYYRKLHIKNHANLIHLRNDIEKDTNYLRSYHKSLL